MKTLEEWAKHYYENGIHIWMPRTIDPKLSWDYYYKQSLADLETHDWSKHYSLMGMTSRQGVIVVSLKVPDKSEQYKSILLCGALRVLGLDRYPWIITTDTTIDIIIKSYAEPFVNRQDIICLPEISVLLEGVFTLPTNDSSETFYFNAIPTTKLKKVNYRSVLDLIYIVSKYPDFLFSPINSNNWKIENGTAGEGLIGVTLKENDALVKESKVGKQAFLNLSTYNIDLVIEDGMWIEEGFIGSTSKIRDVEGYEYWLNRAGKKTLVHENEQQKPHEDTSDRDNWDAMTDGMYGDYPEEGFDGDYEFMGR